MYVYIPKVADILYKDFEITHYNFIVYRSPAAKYKVDKNELSNKMVTLQGVDI